MKRYDLLADNTTYPLNGYMEECDDGSYVEYDEVKKTIDQLRAEVAKMTPVYDAAIKVAPAWQWHCDMNPFVRGFEDSKELIDLMDKVREVER